MGKSKKGTSGRKKEISIDEIRNRAHQLYQERMQNHVKGNACQDWIKAEKELITNN